MSAPGAELILMMAEYFAQKGDTLWRIGQAFDYNFEKDEEFKKLQDANPAIKPTDTINSGATVTIPGLVKVDPTDPVQKREAKYTVPTFLPEQYYSFPLTTTLRKIANGFSNNHKSYGEPFYRNIPANRVIAANPLIKDPNDIPPGTVIYISGLWWTY